METVKRMVLLMTLWAIAAAATALVPYVWAHELESRRVVWLILATGSVIGAALLTWLEMQLRRQPRQAARPSRPMQQTR
ncbi:hypothetical protein ABZT23_30350 [Streptomyces sp. NPDC005386]|uniref:hypothetical protein n=1 Tax=unclassified Streptomyces TaxID=2593676 RepID=UPI0033B96C5A